MTSWTFCPRCGRRRFDGGIDEYRVCTPDKHCDAPPDVLESEAPEGRGRHVEYYSTPDPSHWPRYDPALQAYRLVAADAPEAERGMESMLELPVEEAEALAPLGIQVEVLIRRAGRSVTVNQQKKSVCRATWKERPVAEVLEAGYAMGLVLVRQRSGLARGLLQVL